MVLQCRECKGTFTHARADAGGRGRRRAEKWLQHKSLHVFTHARSRSRGGAGAKSAPRAPNHHCLQEMADPPASAPRMCEHTCGNGAEMSKSARLRSATAPRMCERSLKVRLHMRGRAQAAAGGKLASTQIITCVHTCAVAERRRSGSKIRSARNGSNTQFAAPASKPRAPNHHCPQEMADPPAYVWTYPQ